MSRQDVMSLRLRRGRSYREGPSTAAVFERLIGRPSCCPKCATLNGHKRVACLRCGMKFRESCS